MVNIGNLGNKYNGLSCRGIPCGCPPVGGYVEQAFEDVTGAKRATARGRPYKYACPPSLALSRWVRERMGEHF